ncbi:hypothetical protein K438DRAFT_1925934 [Mycena galopus ATCC 62051]|nr:hypothetical protein K438DRAFT_1925934 [Mycena galopus ATCC 62051]
MMASVRRTNSLYTCRFPVRHVDTFDILMGPRNMGINQHHQKTRLPTHSADMDTSNTYQMDLADEEDNNDMDWDVTVTTAATILHRCESALVGWILAMTHQSSRSLAWRGSYHWWWSMYEGERRKSEDKDKRRGRPLSGWVGGVVVLGHCSAWQYKSQFGF